MILIILIKQFIRKVKLDPSFRELNFNSLSVQSVSKKKMCDFIFQIPDFYVNPWLIS